MDKKTILEAARNNGERGNEYEREKSTKLLLISVLITIFVGIFLFAYDCFVKGHVNISLMVLGLSMCATDFLHEGIVFKQVGKIISGIVLAILALLCLMIWVVL